MASPHPHDVPTVLLIGSTGHGKSTLGNFLLDPKEQREQQVFKTATANAPETQEVTVGYSQDETLCVIDTPGLNEGASQDLRHMIDVIRALREREQVSACILCFKFDATIDAQYKATIAYYRNLLPSLFEGNVLIVLTNYATDKRAERMRERQGIDVDKIVSNTVQEMRDGASLTYDPQVFLIDCLPLDMDSDDKGREISESTRAAILSYTETMLPIKVEDLKVAKTDALKQCDSAEIRALDGQIHGYNARLKEVNAKALEDIESMEKERYEVDRQLLCWREELQDKDSQQHVTAAEWSLKKEFLQAQWQEEDIECASEWPVVAHTKWDNGHLKWENFTVTGDRACGKVKGEFLRGVYANVTLKTTKSHKYSNEIVSLRNRIDEANVKSKRLQDSIEKAAADPKGKNQHETLQNYIKKKNQMKMRLSRDQMTLEEAEHRIADLQKKQTPTVNTFV